MSGYLIVDRQDPRRGKKRKHHEHVDSYSCCCSHRCFSAFGFCPRNDPCKHSFGVSACFFRPVALRTRTMPNLLFLPPLLDQRQSVSFRRLPTQTDALKGPLHLSTTQFLGPTLKWISLQASVCLAFLLLHYNEPQAGALSKLTFCDVVPLSRCPILGSPGEHGVHVHSYGDVSSATGAATGPHYNPFEEEHGCYPGARKVGDMGNVIVSGQGDGKYIELENTLMRLRGESSVLGRGVRSYAIRIATSIIFFFSLALLLFLSSLPSFFSGRDGGKVSCGAS